MVLSRRIHQVVGKHTVYPVEERGQAAVVAVAVAIGADDLVLQVKSFSTVVVSAEPVAGCQMWLLGEQRFQPAVGP